MLAAFDTNKIVNRRSVHWVSQLGSHWCTSTDQAGLICSAIMTKPNCLGSVD